MAFENLALFSLIAVSVLLIVYVVNRWKGGGGTERAGLLLLLVLVVLPSLLAFAGLSAHLKMSKTTNFCLSCHVMEPYGRSLFIDDAALLPAAHFQNRRVARDQACYTCHTSYAMFGDLSAKLNGAKHLWVNYVTGPPDNITLYQSYRNRECLHCHEGARSFAESPLHADLLEDFRSETTSCLDCHSENHAVGDLEQKNYWKPAGGP